MNILVIDGQGGRIGAQVVKAVSAAYPDAELTAVGTNSAATAAMLKNGARRGATGENAVAVACRRADVIIGPVAMVIADALLGEVTPAMAMAVGQADAVRILIPASRCENLVAGVGEELTMGQILDDVMAKLAPLAGR
jgi:hypothetical protein